MKILLTLAFLIPAMALQAQQAAPAAGKRSTPAATKPSTPAAGKRSTPAAANLSMPVEAKPATPVPAKSSEPEAPKPRANWEVYTADHVPPGKNLTDAEAAKLEPGDYLERKPLYLVGSFYVVVAEKGRAILWPGEKLGPIRVVVSYPLPIPTPAEGARLVREAPRGFRITKIKRASVDDVTIYVRDITLQ